MIRFAEVSKRFPGQEGFAVSDLSLEIPPGHIFGLLGPNGAGKSTTLKMAVGLLAPTRGQVTVLGMDMVTHALEIKRRIAYVPDQPNIYPRLRGGEYLRFIADVFGVPGPKREERISDLLALFDLEAALSSRIEEYSHGMRQKLVLIAALLHNPEVLVLDEPLVGLDPRTARTLKDLLRQRSEAGCTVVFSTHVLEVAEQVCDLLAIIQGGRLLATGTLEELRSHSRQGAGDLESLFLELTGS